jgi:hypothetical protein
MCVQVSVRKAESAINSLVMQEITEALSVDYEKVIGGPWMSTRAQGAADALPRPPNSGGANGATKCLPMHLIGRMAKTRRSSGSALK